jgi:hypothetical protein
MPKKDRRGRMEEQIDENLRRVYAQAVEEDVPDRFLRLLDELRKKEGGAGESGGGRAKS